MKVFVTGGTGVLGRAGIPMLATAGYEVVAPVHEAVDLFSPEAVAEAVEGAGAVFHLATRIPARDRFDDPGAWVENDRLRTEVSRILVDAGLEAGVETYVQAGITFVYPAEGEATEETPVADVPYFLQSALDAEKEAQRVTTAGRRGVIMRFGYLDGPGTGNDAPNHLFGATLHVEDAGRALVLAVSVPAGVYNVVRDGERISNQRFSDLTGWRPLR